MMISQKCIVCAIREDCFRFIEKYPRILNPRRSLYIYYKLHFRSLRDFSIVIIAYQVMQEKIPFCKLYLLPTSKLRQLENELVQEAWDQNSDIYEN